MFCFGGAVGFMREFCGLELTKRSLFAVNPNSGNPSVFVLTPRCANESRGVGLLWFARNILTVLRLICLSHIVNTIATRISVLMVKSACRPAPVHIEPCQSVGIVSFAVNSYCQSAISHSGSGRTADFHSTNFVRWCCFPSKYASLGIVVQKFTQAICGKIIGSHAVAPFKQWFGQKPACASNACGLRHFNTALTF